MGSFVVESMFLIPGLGRYFVDSVTNLDYPLIMGLTVFYGAFLVTMNLIVDVLWINRSANPRKVKEKR